MPQVRWSLQPKNVCGLNVEDSGVAWAGNASKIAKTVNIVLT